MTEQMRVDSINSVAREKLEQFLMQLETQELSEDDMLAYAYAALVTVGLLGYNLEFFTKDAIARVAALHTIVEEEAS